MLNYSHHHWNKKNNKVLKNSFTLLICFCYIFLFLLSSFHESTIFYVCISWVFWNLSSAFFMIVISYIFFLCFPSFFIFHLKIHNTSIFFLSSEVVRLLFWIMCLSIHLSPFLLLFKNNDKILTYHTLFSQSLLTSRKVFALRGINDKTDKWWKWWK